MKRFTFAKFFLSLSFASALIGCAENTANAHGYKLGDLDIAHPHTHVTAPGQAVGGVFFKHIANSGDKADRLIGASIAVKYASSVELHTMSTENDVMRMRQLNAIELPAKTTVPMTRGLKKDGYHVMLMGLKAPFKAGDKIPLRLKFERAGEIEVAVNVGSLKPDAAMQEHKH